MFLGEGWEFRGGREAARRRQRGDQRFERILDSAQEGRRDYREQGHRRETRSGREAAHRPKARWRGHHGSHETGSRSRVPHVPREVPRPRRRQQLGAQARFDRRLRRALEPGLRADPSSTPPLPEAAARGGH